MGTIVNDAQTANSFGYLDKLIDTSAKDVAMDQAPSQLDTSAQVLYHEAIRYLSAAGKLPWTARTDAKLKSNSGIINNVNQAGLKAVVESIAGKEFQLTASTMLIALKNRKK